MIILPEQELEKVEQILLFLIVIVILAHPIELLLKAGEQFIVLSFCRPEPNQSVISGLDKPCLYLRVLILQSLKILMLLVYRFQGRPELNIHYRGHWNGLIYRIMHIDKEALNQGVISVQIKANLKHLIGHFLIKWVDFLVALQKFSISALLIIRQTVIRAHKVHPVLVQLILYRLQRHILIPVCHDIECIPEGCLISLTVGHISDIANDAVTIVIRSVDPQHLSSKWSIFAGACGRYEVSQMLFPALLGHPLIWFTVELPLNLQTIRPSKPKQLPQAIRVRYIIRAVGDCGEGHEEDQDQDYQASRESFRERSAQSTRFKLSVECSLLRAS